MHQFNEDADPFAALDALEEMVAASPVDGASVVDDCSKSQGTSPLLTALVSRQGSQDQDIQFPLPTSALQARQHFGGTGESMGPFDSSLGRSPFDESPIHKRGSGLANHNHSLNYHDKYFDDTPSPDRRSWQKHHHDLPPGGDLPSDFDDDSPDPGRNNRYGNSLSRGSNNNNNSSSSNNKSSSTNRYHFSGDLGPTTREPHQQQQQRQQQAEDQDEDEQEGRDEEELESWREKARRRRDEEDIHGLESTDWDDSGEDFSNGLEGLYSNREEPLVVASVPNTGRSRKEPTSPNGPRDAEWWDEAATEAVDEARLAAGEGDDLDDLVGELLADSPSNEGMCQLFPTLHCTSCDFEVLFCDSFVWMENVEYMFFRNNYPIFEKLLDGLIRCPGWSAYCCQCSWKSAPQGEDIGTVAEGLRWRMLANA
mmetsp:Transcript_22510/g.49349  ORF Transcript_22510/g.49349 Transcript_22510/m.49349 type:complete len:425 (-) Transcript_22510:40-1314(-)|eukprot:CAMPEP_0206458014 /NCGR_PEP_ID=MMETSP0324_2-20121206/23308_1 /ASSEMBLY_ACC=CAM_ASM_000836 /TAXON_ID=2866 /ORGANISM="Crypthecodinium cohnii, Strain Seligo" /LENGTH=424 /DNA_ID=CAMNT_0053929253 /DNA_START=156 /DNA_END=1430 /DNA_ORIENTATION=+